MRGNVLGFDTETNTGAITGHDAGRYDFVRLEWRAAGSPMHGDLVDFVPQGQRATQIYLIEPNYVRPGFWEFYFSPSGRAGRSDYWLRYFVPVVLISVALTAVAGIAWVTGAHAVGGLFQALHSIFSLVTSWVGIAVLVKRMHDRNKSGWLALLPILVILIGAIFLVVGLVTESKAVTGVSWAVLGLASFGIAVWFFVEFGCLRGTIGANRYGPDPVRLP